MARLAIVIPSVGLVEALETTLVAALQNRPAHCEIIAVHAHPYDDPYELAGEVRLIAAPARSNYLQCLQLGMQAASGSVVNVLAAGSVVEEGWTDGILRHFNDPCVAVVAPLLQSPLDPTTALLSEIDYRPGGLKVTRKQAVAELQSRGVAPILAASPLAAFYNRHVLETVGSFAQHLGLDAAEIDLGLRLRHAGFRSLVDPRRQVTLPAAAPETVSAFRQAVRAEQLFWRAAPLVGWGRALAAHPFAILASVAGSLPFPAAIARFGGHLAGLAGLPAARGYHQRLNDLHQSAPQAVAPASTHLRFDAAHGTAAAHAVLQSPTAKAA